MFRAFPPLIRGNPDILILGTFPSPLSRERGEYYGNPQNKFWKIIFDVFEVEFNDPDYEVKKEILFQNKIAVWDVIESCEIIGALDKNIRNPVYNTALPGFIKDNNITVLLFNGTKAFEFYKRGIEDMNGERTVSSRPLRAAGQNGMNYTDVRSIEKRIMPSTSPANAQMNYAGKLSAWTEGLRRA